MGFASWKAEGEDDVSPFGARRSQVYGLRVLEGRRRREPLRSTSKSSKSSVWASRLGRPKVKTT
ncbi:hypothetical protein EJB05_23681, partial [Eragrostis curvula]